MQKSEKLTQLKDKIRRYYDTDELVFGAGDIDTNIMLVGEAPGKDEIEKGYPFCGRAGENFDEFMHTLDIDRQDIYISNVCKFRPFKVSEKGTVSNRPPTRAEIEEAIPFIYEEIGIISPQLLITLGNTPLRACLHNLSATIGKYHGAVTHTEILGEEYPLFALYHPASIIYNPSLTSTYAEDLENLSATIRQIQRESVR